VVRNHQLLWICAPYPRVTICIVRDVDAMIGIVVTLKFLCNFGITCYLLGVATVVVIIAYAA
jgi:hypothetical protein